MGAVVPPLRPPPKAQAPACSGAGRWPAAHGPAPTQATSVASSLSPASFPSKSSGRAARDRGGRPGPSRVGRRKGRRAGGEGGGRGAPPAPACSGHHLASQGSPGCGASNYSSSSAAPGSRGGGGWREGASETLVEKGSFLPASPRGTVLVIGAWRAGGPAPS